jgi:hypothetical protein
MPTTLLKTLIFQVKFLLDQCYYFEVMRLFEVSNNHHGTFHSKKIVLSRGFLVEEDPIER